MFETIIDSIFCALERFFGEGRTVSKKDILIDSPKDRALGELFTNAAMAFSKRLCLAPGVLAKHVADSLLENENVAEAAVAMPGFVNFNLKKRYWQDSVANIITQGEEYGYVNLKNGESVNVEFVSANPTGPLHTGHARNAVFGSVIANLLERIGHKVTREFYVNDKGNQIESLAKSLYLRYRESLGSKISLNNFSDDMYCGDYLKELADELVCKHQDEFLNKDESDWIEFFKDFAVKKMLQNIEADLASLDIKIDIYTSETALCNRKLVEEALAILTRGNNIYEGILPKPKGFVLDDWEERPQTLFKSTKYGDDIDRPIKKSDGSWTYFAGDLAYHLDKIKRGYNRMVAILGADHNGYVNRLKAAVTALSSGAADIEIRLYQLVNFMENGVAVRMSKRAGNFITLKKIVERVGKDATRYMMISRHHDVMIDFDFVKTVEFSMENPVFYVQYAYARICSIFRNFESNFEKIDVDELKNCNKDSLTDEAEILLIKALCFWPNRIVSAAVAIEPHRIPVYLQEIAHLFHSLWNNGKYNAELRFIDVNNETKSLARLSMLYATKLVLEDGFNLIGIKPMKEMK